MSYPLSSAPCSTSSPCGRPNRRSVPSGSCLFMRAQQPVTPAFAHHNTLVDHFTAQAGNIIMESPQDGVHLLFVVEPTPLERTRHLFHNVAPFLVLRRNTDQPPIFDKSGYDSRAFFAFRRQ